MANIRFKLTTPEGVKLEDEVDQVTVTTMLGQVTILPHHLPLMACVVSGEMVMKKGATEIPLVVHGGFLEVQTENRVTILADSAERVEELDEKTVEEAIQRAQTLMREKFNTQDYEDAALAFEREAARSAILRKYRTKGYRAGHHSSSPTENL
ncbi:MAG: ATP synthase F1 subunit epsilon [Patescibacteria group bacterium]